MKELLLMAATLVPEDKILEDVQDAIVEYQMNKSEDNKNKLNTHMHMAIMRFMTDGDPKRMHEVMQKMKKFDRQQELFTPDKN
jgi:hypothetical protein